MNNAVIHLWLLLHQQQQLQLLLLQLPQLPPQQGAPHQVVGSSCKERVEHCVLAVVELRGGSSSEGNVFVNGEPVCDDQWDRRDASVVCRMLGYYFIIHFTSLYFNIDMKGILVENLRSTQPLEEFLTSLVWMMWGVLGQRHLCLTVGTIRRTIVGVVKVPGSDAQVG